MFDPSAVAISNGNFFGFPYTPKEAEILLLGIPWDVTTSYREGTALGPASILQASTQLDFVSPFREQAWNTKIATLPTPKQWRQKSKRLRKIAKAHIQRLENGKKPLSLAALNKESANVHDEIYQLVKANLAKAPVICVGGDHSVSYGPIKAYQEKYRNLSILHIDAHADLRESYEGFPHSHASIMNHVEQMPNVARLVQVGIRDFAPAEQERIERSAKIRCHYDWNLQKKKMQGASWAALADTIIADLGPEVYLSFDIDGLDPKYCPNTGTPVLGGLQLEEVLLLLEKLQDSGRKLVGADLVEVAPDPKGNNEWDANVGARLLFQICQFVRNSQTK
jgi:agmatinase